ncbi:unnamed protein product [Paramecium pentaurelia]|uniref:STOP protein n=1 Tax=Paramecium pentaurelia TaxID=43138 RepID=A0A8S1V1M7_9CILI|nr:unnamed protein product [Paramecium pentaurelia]
MPQQKIIIRSRSNKQGSKLSSPRGDLTDTQTKLVERLMSRQKNGVNKEEQQFQSYFEHLGGQCICSLCNCGRHQCEGKQCRNRPSMHGNRSIYQREYVHKSPDQSAHYNQNLFDNPKQEGDIGNVSTYKHDFLGSQSNFRFKSNSPQSVLRSGPFCGLSTYNNMYLNWGSGDTVPLLSQKNPTVIRDLPFFGRTNYRECFQGAQVQPAQSTKGFHCNKSPLSPPNMKFNGISVTKSSYQPYRTDKFTNFKEQTQYQLNPSYQGQYNSEYFKEFDPKYKQPCPAKQVLEEVSQQC